MHKCYYLVQPTNMLQKLNIELLCKFGKVKVTVPSSPRLLYKGVSSRGGGEGTHPTSEICCLLSPRLTASSNLQAVVDLMQAKGYTKEWQAPLLWKTVGKWGLQPPQGANAPRGDCSAACYASSTHATQ